MWNYLTMLFLVSQPEFEVSEIEPHRENGELWQFAACDNPAGVPTHWQGRRSSLAKKGYSDKWIM